MTARTKDTEEASPMNANGNGGPLDGAVIAVAGAAGPGR